MRNVESFAWYSNLFSVDEVIIKNIGVFYTVILKKSLISFVSIETTRKMTNEIAHQRNILEIQKPLEVPIFLELVIFFKTVGFYLVTKSL